MPRIIVCKDMQDYRIIEFSDRVSIGRDQNNEILLDSRGVSRNHALVHRQDDGYHVIDQGSKNAVWVGNDMVREFTLSHGLTFRIADYLLTFIDDDLAPVETKVCSFENIDLLEKKAINKETMLMINFNNKKKKQDPAEASLVELETRFNLLLQLIEKGPEYDNEEKLLSCLLESILQAAQAEGGFFAVKDRGGELVYKASKNFSPQSDNKKVDHGVIHLVMEKGETHVSDQLKGHLLGEKSNHIYLCAPFKCDGTVTGCCYLLRTEKSFFSKIDILLTNLILSWGAIQYKKHNTPQLLMPSQAALDDSIGADKDIIVRSSNMVQLYGDVKTISTINVPLLILGEPGTGKELVALALHKDSGRKGQYVTLNCSAIPEGIFESELFGSVKGAFHNATDRKGKLELAHKGTLFLDEIGDMALALQPKLLRFLENQELTRLGDTRVQKLDVRIVAATNQDLNSMIDQKQFRPDLYQRLSCFSLKVPPLRERIDDIEPLAHFFLNKFDDEYGLPRSKISQGAMDILKRYSWSGNVRELRNAMLRLAVHSQGATIVPENLSHLVEAEENEVVHKVSSFPSLDEMEREHIQAALQYADGNISDGSKLLGIARSTFYKKLKKYNITEGLV